MFSVANIHLTFLSTCFEILLLLNEHPHNHRFVSTSVSVSSYPIYQFLTEEEDDTQSISFLVVDSQAVKILDTLQQLGDLRVFLSCPHHSEVEV